MYCPMRTDVELWTAQVWNPFRLMNPLLACTVYGIVHCRAPQASTGIPAGWVLHGLKMTSQLLVAERRLLGDVNPSQHTQFSELKSICSNPTSLCSSTGLPQIVMTLTVSGGILSRVSHCSVLTLYYTQTPMVIYEVPNVHGRPQIGYM